MRIAVRTTQTAAIGALILSLGVIDAHASGVGASIYVPGKAAPAVRQASCQTGTCAPVSGCSGCQRLGFACVDHATPAPCTAEGGCHPNRSTFGYTKPRWRQWPGAKYNTGGPQAADPSDQLPPVEEPTPEDEDKQAPPPIEDVESPSDPAGDEPGVPGFEEEGPGIEVTLPPLPEGPLPVPRPNATPPFQNNAPPALPFGFENRSRAPSESQWDAPPAPFTKMPANLPKPAAGDDAPPPLPQGFTGATPEQLLRRLPTTRPVGRYDRQIRQASAQTPIR